MIIIKNIYCQILSIASIMPQTSLSPTKLFPQFTKKGKNANMTLTYQGNYIDYRIGIGIDSTKIELIENRIESI